MLSHSACSLACFWARTAHSLSWLLQDIADKPFAVITYTEAIKRLQRAEATFEFHVEWGLDLQSEHERYLTEKEFAGIPLFVTDYPKGIKVQAQHPPASQHSQQALRDLCCVSSST